MDGDDIMASGRAQAAGNALGAVPIVVALGPAQAAATFRVVGSILPVLLDPHGSPRGVVYDGVAAAAAAAAVAVLQCPLIDDELPLVDDIPRRSVTLSQVASYMVCQIITVFLVTVVGVGRHCEM